MQRPLRAAYYVDSYAFLWGNYVIYVGDDKNGSVGMEEHSDQMVTTCVANNLFVRQDSPWSEIITKYLNGTEERQKKDYKDFIEDSDASMVRRHCHRISALPYYKNYAGSCQARRSSGLDSSSSSRTCRSHSCGRMLAPTSCAGRGSREVMKLRSAVLRNSADRTNEVWAASSPVAAAASPAADPLLNSADLSQSVPMDAHDLVSVASHDNIYSPGYEQNLPSYTSESTPESLDQHKVIYDDDQSVMPTSVEDGQEYEAQSVEDAEERYQRLYQMERTRTATIGSPSRPPRSPQVL